MQLNNNKQSNDGFLPDDYVQAQAERRTNVLAVSLFAVVMVGVALAYLVTDRTWNDVKSAQESVNVRFDAASDRIAEMTAYENRVSKMVDKAHIAVGLLDSVPRSNLLAEIVGRMPDTLSLTRFKLGTQEIKPPRDKPVAVATLSTRQPSSANQAGAGDEVPRPEPRRWSTTIEIEGLAPSLEEVSLFIDALVGVDLFRRVRLDHTLETEIDDRSMRGFRILFELEPEADIRLIDPSTIAQVASEGD